MTLKSFLLGSAAALLAVGGAQAADVSFPVAEPVNYVKVCDAFGTGYFYQPGTDTCIKISGYVRFDVKLGDNVGSAYATSWATSGGASNYTTYSNIYSTVPVLVTSGGTVVGTVSGESTYSYVGASTYYYDVYEIGNNDDHEFVTKAYLSVSARTQTELGLLTSFLAFNGDTAGAAESPQGGVTVDEAYLSLGPLLAGYTGSTFDPGGGYGLYGLSRSDVTADQIRLSWAFGGFGIMVAAEDYQDRINAGSDVTFKSVSTGEIPDLVAALTASWGGVDAKVAVGYGQRVQSWGFADTYSTWGVSARAEVNLDALSAGSRLKLVFGYSQDGGEWIGLKDNFSGDYYNVLGSLRVFVSPTVAIDVSGSWSQAPYYTQTEAAGDVYYMPVSGFTAAAGVHWKSTEWDGKDADDSVEGLIRLQRDF